MNKKIIFLSLFIPFYTFCTKQTNVFDSASDNLADPSAKPVKAIQKYELSAYAGNPAIGYYEAVQGYTTLENGVGNEPFPNSRFTEWVDYCWMWGQYGQKNTNADKRSLVTLTKQEFIDLFDLKVSQAEFDCNKLKEYNIRDVKDVRTFLAPLQGVRMTPKYYLSARYAQLYVKRPENSGYYFNGATLKYGTDENPSNNQPQGRDLGLIKPLDAVNKTGVVLKNVKGSADVNGQMTTGVPRAYKPSPAHGFIETVFNLPDNLANYKFSSKPKAFKARLKYVPMTGNEGVDKAIIEVMMHGDKKGVRLPCKTKAQIDQSTNVEGVQTVCDNALAYTRLIIDQPVPDFQTVEVPIYYQSDDVRISYLLVNISAGFEYKPVENSELSLEFLEFVY